MWTVSVTKKAGARLAKLPDKYKRLVAVLIREIEVSGPVRGNWPNYSKLKKTSIIAIYRGLADPPTWRCGR